MKLRNVWILGSTGSIGTQALDVVSHHPERFRVQGIAAAGSRYELLARQAVDFDVPQVAISCEKRVDDFSAAVRTYVHTCAQIGRKTTPQVLAGIHAVVDLISHAQPEDVILNGITGAIGLAPTLAALRTGATLALANKESLVAGGDLVRAAMVRPGQIIPVDSEHSAIFQALHAGVHRRGLTSGICDGSSDVRRIILTASGGPFRGYSRSDLAHVSREQALNHPTWNMGPVVTINSATLMNKALELIEAAYLFDVPAENIIPIVHPQSMVHSAVEFIDGSTIAQASPPDMRLPIALGLSWPERLESTWPSCDWASAHNWTFEPLDHEAFPAVSMAQAALKASPLHPAVMNAANEQAVHAFLEGKLSFLGITDVVRSVMDKFYPSLDAKNALVCETHVGENSSGNDSFLQPSSCAEASESANHSGRYTYEHVMAAQAWARACADGLISASVQK